ncbi:sodium:solute symporter family protein [Halobacillus karajensis]|uniref:Na(+)/glucose symporter n=1 Tax=Halobacillus karajensis TaxID=195088 RepID=A0A059NZ02_9BACI|nr:sodium:solute symporter family protein [Halobacillus karajensis]CDQ18983.1 Na(+)/glucose symporter [Halobacillus karajensis]CDQ22943.1 Na(+)/glucose symporter [Halobacillus karajensis]CDQ26426.1 Na(+)/glucose symporter [Halobacillus karajensis]
MLPSYVGYGLLLVFGLFFTLITFVMQRRKKQAMTAEQFSTAGRSVGVGLASASIIAAWTWAATLMMSSSTGYQYGISGPYWYAAGACIQVLLFAIVAINLKKRAPNAHTFLEFIGQRFDKKNHRLIMGFALMTNILVTSMVVLGGAIALNSLTGMNIFVAAFLIPLTFTIYTMIGGLKASFIADYFNTVMIFTILAIFATVVYVKFGIDPIYEGLSSMPSSDSMLTMASVSGLFFGMINIIGNFGAVFVDQAYWQRAIASKDSAASRAYIYGGISWFSIPFAIATFLGVSAAGLGITVGTPDSVAPEMAAHLLGGVGSILFLAMLFMAVMSTGAAELTAITNIIVTDIYRKSINPKASSDRLLNVSRKVTLGFGLMMGVLSILLFKVGIGLGWVYMAMGIFVSGAVIPVTLGLLWKKATNEGTFYGASAGLVLGVTAWFTSAYLIFGEISIRSLGELQSMFFGNITVFLVSGTISIGHALISNQEFDFESLKGKFRSFDDEENDDKIIEEEIMYEGKQASAK